MNENKDTDGTSDYGPEKPRDDDGKDRFSNPDHKSIGIVIAEIVGVGVFGTLSNIAFSTDHKVAGIWFSFGATASLLGMLGTTLARRFSRKKVWGMCGLVSCLIAIWFLLWTLSLPKPLQLTNSFLLFPDKFPPQKREVKGGLFIPVASEHSSNSLSFALLADRGLSVDSARFMIAIPKGLKFSAYPGWERAESELSQTMDSFTYRRFPPSIFPNDAEELPPITFFPIIKGNSSDAFIIYVAIDAKGMPKINVAFRILFTLTQSITKPHIVVGTRTRESDQDLHFEFPTDP